MLNKKDQAYYFFKENILNQKWKIEDAINLIEVCAELKMSRTPVIESLKELEKEGFVTIVPQVGAYVRRPTEDEMYERILIRIKLDSLMSEVAAEKITESQLAQLRKLLDSMDDPTMEANEYAIKNREFHEVIYDASGLVHIKSVAIEYWDYLRYLEAQELLFRNEHRSRSILEHRMIYHALEERNKPLVKQLVESHNSRALNLQKKDEASRSALTF